MRKRIMQFTFLWCALAIAALLATTAWTQSPTKEKPPVYTYVSEWAIPRAMWGDYVKAEAATGESMNKLVADGTLLSSGSFSVLNHQEGAPTHGSWFSASSIANLMKVLEGLRSLVTSGWQWGSLAKALLAVAIVAAVSMSLCLAALRGRTQRG